MCRRGIVAILAAWWLLGVDDYNRGVAK